MDTAAVIDWLVISTDNPRSLRFQAEEINRHLGFLPAELAPRSVAALRLQSLRVLGEIRLNDASHLAARPAEAGKLFRDLQSHLTSAGDELNHIYFSHTDSR